jgi:hypothetical protein
MADLNPTQLDGECQNCGLPGIIGLTCSECGGPIIGLVDAKTLDKPENEEESDRYSADDLEAEPTDSLEELAEAEVNTPNDSSDDTMT